MRSSETTAVTEEPSRMRQDEVNTITSSSENPIAAPSHLNDVSMIAPNVNDITLAAATTQPAILGE